MAFQSFKELEFEVEYPKTGAFATISPGLEISRLIRSHFNSIFGEDTGPAQRWLNNKHIDPADFKAVEAFEDCFEYHFLLPNY